jgi:hypothetical protein
MMVMMMSGEVKLVKAKLIEQKRTSMMGIK